MPVNKNILWIDCAAGALAGVITLLLSAWLSALYAIPEDILLFIGAANLLYACYSFSLAIRSQRPESLVKLLVLANATWSLVCIGIIAKHAGTVTLLGSLHIVGEAIFVGRLAFLEWKWRKQLLIAA